MTSKSIRPFESFYFKSSSVSSASDLMCLIEEEISFLFY